MTEITDFFLTPPKPRCSVSPSAFVGALILAPIVVTALTFWTVIGFFALFLGAIPYLLVGTPVLLWAVGHVHPEFSNYAKLGLISNIAAGLAYIAVFSSSVGIETAMEQAGFLFGFGLIFAPLYAGAFGSLYARFHPNIRILNT